MVSWLFNAFYKRIYYDFSAHSSLYIWSEFLYVYCVCVSIMIIIRAHKKASNSDNEGWKIGIICMLIISALFCNRNYCWCSRSSCYIFLPRIRMMLHVWQHCAVCYLLWKQTFIFFTILGKKKFQSDDRFRTLFICQTVSCVAKGLKFPKLTFLWNSNFFWSLALY